MNKAFQQKQEERDKHILYCPLVIEGYVSSFILLSYILRSAVGKRQNEETEEKERKHAAQKAAEVAASLLGWKTCG
jgi:hypothetical protein